MLLSNRTLVLVFAFAGGLALAASSSLAQSEGREDAAEKEQRQQTRQRMLDRWKKLRAHVRIDGDEREVDRLGEPIFTFSEPTRETGHLGTVWVWGTKGRPVALLSQNKAYGQPVWGFELVALSEGVSVVMHDGWKWSPESALKMTPFVNSPPPAASDGRRLSQMKNLVEQFTITERYQEQSIELRLLPRSVYRYEDKESGLIDGALFCFAHGTNPEVFAVIECRKESSSPVWSYGFLPLAGAGVTAKLEDKTVWSKEPTRESRAQAMYSTWLETEQK